METKKVTTDTDRRLMHTGCVQLLCDCYVDVADSELRESILQAVDDWCEATGWAYKYTNFSVVLLPPENTEG